MISYNLTKDELSKLKNKDLKEFIDSIDYKKDYKSNELINFANLLLSDTRKNIISLGEKINKNINKILLEIERVKKLYSFDKSFGNNKYVAGVDEVGRGPLAGPIVACAVVLDLDALDDELILGLNDSKKISLKKRQEIAEIIKEKAVSYSIGICDNKEIDEKGIAYCNNKIFLDSCYGLKVEPNLVLSDGYLVKNIKYPNESVIKGDAKSASIAAASILAKVYRDNLMCEYSKKYPYYAFEENAGYGTAKHIDGLKEKGPCELHRLSFLTKIL